MCEGEDEEEKNNHLKQRASENETEITIAIINIGAGEVQRRHSWIQVTFLKHIACSFSSSASRPQA